MLFFNKLHLNIFQAWHERKMCSLDNVLYLPMSVP